MPFLRIELSQAVDRETAKCAAEKARKAIHEAKGDPESMISVSVLGDVVGVFGTNANLPAANIQLISFGMNADVTAQLTRRLSRILWEDLGVPADFCYMFFSNVDPGQEHLVSWSGLTFAEILLPQAGSREELPRRVRGRIVNSQPSAKGKKVPLGGLRLELWDPTPATVSADGGINGDGTKASRFLGSGFTRTDGFFEVFFARAPGPDQPPSVLSLRIFEPDQFFIAEGHPVMRRFIAAALPVPDDGQSPDLPLGAVSVKFYEYDSQWPFPYAVPDSIRQKFSPLQESRYGDAQRFSVAIGAKLFAELDSNPRGLSITQIQDSFPPNLTIQMEQKQPGSSRADDFFAHRLLNCMVPPVFRIDPCDANPLPTGDSNVYVLDYNWKSFERRTGTTLLSFRARFTSDTRRLMPLDIALGLDQEDDPARYTTFTPADGPSWEQAKRVVRAYYNNFVAQFQGHLGLTHFNMEQYGIAFLRTLRNNPARQLMYPFIKEILAINEKGRYTLLGGPGIVFQVEPITQRAVSRWVVDTLGRADWKGWKPRRPICDDHGYAKMADLYWSLLDEVVSSFFRENVEGIRAHWSEIHDFSDTLVAHSVPYVARGMEEPSVAGTWYCTNEIAQPRREGSKAVHAITDHDSDPTDAELANLEQVCRYVIFHSTLFHSWSHYYMLTDLGELRYSGMLRNGGMGPESDDSVLAIPVEAAYGLGSTHALYGMNCGYMLRNEDGDCADILIRRLKEHREDVLKWGFDVDWMCSRLNT